MCLAIFKPAGKEVTKEHLENGFNSNNHGAGIAYAHDSKLYIEKGFFKFEEFYKVYQKVEALPCLIHFRIRTSGGQDAVNCHPWRVSENLALIHNGIMALKEEEGMSDTGVFTKYVLGPIIKANPELWKAKGVQWLIAEAIGTGNKIVLMDNAGDHVILNEKQGDWEKGCWFSNTSYRWKYSRSSGMRDYDSDWPRGGYSGSYGSCGTTTRTSNPRWHETSVPHVYLLSKEHAARWKDKKDDKTVEVEATTATTTPASREVIVLDKMLQNEIDKLKADGWVEWQPEAVAQ